MFPMRPTRGQNKNKVYLSNEAMLKEVTNICVSMCLFACVNNIVYKQPILVRMSYTKILNKK